MAKTKISWTESTWNVSLGCRHVSEGCRNCYAEKMTIRLNAMAAANGNDDLWAACSDVLKFDYSETELGKAVGFNGEIKLMYDRLQQPLHWKKPRRIFVDSMSDLFHEKIPFEFIEKVITTIDLADWHIFQVLTKRPERALEFIGWYEKKEWLLPKNLWLGVSVENQKAAEKRIPLLLEMPASVRWISAEPLLELVDLNKYHIDWVVVGAESMGGKAGRECKNEWIENIVSQCREAIIPVFVKQIQKDGKIVKDINQFPKHLQIQEYPKTQSEQLTGYPKIKEEIE